MTPNPSSSPNRASRFHDGPVVPRSSGFQNSTSSATISRKLNSVSVSITAV